MTNHSSIPNTQTRDRTINQRKCENVHYIDVGDKNVEDEMYLPTWAEKSTGHDPIYESNDHGNVDSMLVEWRLITIFSWIFIGTVCNERHISEAPFKFKFVPQQNKVIASQSEKVSTCHSN